MSLWKRNKLPNGHTYSENTEVGEGSFFLLRDDPLSSHFEPKIGDKPKDLVNYMLALQVRQFDKLIDLTYPALVRNMKLLLKEYDAMMIKRAIKYASQVAEHPFSTKFVKEVIEQVEEKME